MIHLIYIMAAVITNMLDYKRYLPWKRRLEVARREVSQLIN